MHFDDEVGRIFQSCGVGEELRRITEPADIYEWRNAAGTTLLRFGRVSDQPLGWPLSSMFNQPALEALLDRRARALPTVEVRRGVEVCNLAQDEYGVTLRMTNGEEVRARYVVGCDGANSTVRDLVGFAVHDLGYFYDWLVVDVVLDNARVFDPLNVQICDPARPTTVVSGGPGRRRWEFMRLPHESLDELNDESRAWELLEPWDVHPRNARLERHAVYTFRAQYTEHWRAARVLLAGDAAHLMPPFAGQGMCAGVRDAANLAWKLDLVLTDRARATLLDSYEQERLPSARAAIEFSMELGKVICIPDAAAAAARDEAMVAAVGPKLTDAPPLPGLAAGFIHASSPNSGQVCIQPTVAGGHFDDVHGAGWRLLTVDREIDALDEDAHQWFNSIGGLVVQLRAPALAAHDATYVLQRPDFRIYGTATTSAGACALIDDLRARLSATTPSLKGTRP